MVGKLARIFFLACHRVLCSTDVTKREEDDTVTHDGDLLGRHDGVLAEAHLDEDELYHLSCRALRLPVESCEQTLNLNHPRHLAVSSGALLAAGCTLHVSRGRHGCRMG